MSLEGCQINPIDINFHLQKSLESFDKNSADKISSKKDNGVESASLMPIRVNLPVSLPFFNLASQKVKVRSR